MFIKLWSVIFDKTKHFKQWTSFILSAYNKLSEYEIQKDTEKIIAELGVNNGVNSDNFKEFLEKIKKYGLESELENFQPNESEIKLLNDVLTTTLKSQISKNCQSDRLIIRGDYVKLSDLSKVNDCSINYVQIFSLNKFFVDDDLDRIGKKFKLAVVAPEFQIIGDRKINLDGEKVQNFVRRLFVENGKPGSPGLPGGSLLFVGKRILNKNFLQITANGGNGERGENGREGEKGRTAKMDPDHYFWKYKGKHFRSKLRKILIIWYIFWFKYKGEDNCPNNSVFDGSDNFECTRQNECPASSGGKGDKGRFCYMIHGKSGSDGSNGGKGGL